MSADGPGGVSGELSDSTGRHSGRVPTGPFADVTAVMLTYMRPSLAGDVARYLLDVEGLPPDRVVVVVNGVGGLDDPALESVVRMVRLPTNTGPAGGFRAGLLEAFSDPTTRWAYLVEDDITLLDLPRPRLADLMVRIHDRGPADRPVGAVVAFGRRFIGRGTHTVNCEPVPGSPSELSPVDVGSWGATVVSRAVVEAGVLPEPEWFFGLEDFDFYCRVREAGFAVLMDDVTALRVARQQTAEGREAAYRHRRPNDDSESWRAYYDARNAFALARRHGSPTWYLWHLVYSARKFQVARSGAERSAIVHGMWDGALGRMGENRRYRRVVGELVSPTEPASPESAPESTSDGPGSTAR
jgi:GT2 family glycosyltransferase